MRGILLALAVMVAAPFVRLFGQAETTTLPWGATRRFAEELDSDEEVERAIFRREAVIVVVIAAAIAARIALV